MTARISNFSSIDYFAQYFHSIYVFFDSIIIYDDLISLGQKNYKSVTLFLQKKKNNNKKTLKK